MTMKHGVARHKGTQDVIVISENLIANRVQGFVIVTSSAPAGVIILTSGAHTIYLTDVFVSVDDLVDVQLCSEVTAFAVAYLATRGGFKMEQVLPYVCTTNQSFRVILSSDVNCGVSFVGYTVT